MNLSLVQFRVVRRYNSRHTLCVPKTCKTLDSGLKNGELEEILYAHNRYRAEVSTGATIYNHLPKASDMLLLEWDDDLAATAQAHAELCSFDHDCPSCRRLSKFFFPPSIPNGCLKHLLQTSTLKLYSIFRQIFVRRPKSLSRSDECSESSGKLDRLYNEMVWRGCPCSSIGYSSLSICPWYRTFYAGLSRCLQNELHSCWILQIKLQLCVHSGFSLEQSIDVKSTEPILACFLCCRRWCGRERGKLAAVSQCIRPSSRLTLTIFSTRAITAQRELSLASSICYLHYDFISCIRRSASSSWRYGFSWTFERFAQSLTVTFILNRLSNGEKEKTNRQMHRWNFSHYFILRLRRVRADLDPSYHSQSLRWTSTPKTRPVFSAATQTSCQTFTSIQLRFFPPFLCQTNN